MVLNGVVWIFNRWCMDRIWDLRSQYLFMYVIGRAWSLMDASVVRMGLNGCKLS